eukprot:1155613-Pelagomonas_calceolata.AAC.5
MPEHVHGDRAVFSLSHPNSQIEAVHADPYLIVMLLSARLVLHPAGMALALMVGVAAASFVRRAAMPMFKSPISGLQLRKI